MIQYRCKMSNNQLKEAQKQCNAEIATAISKKYSISLQTNVELHFEPNRKADASFAAFSLAAQLKKKPFQIAEEIAREIKPTKFIESVNALNGFVNFTFSQAYFEKTLKETSEKNYGKKQKNKKIAIVEYSSPNVGKPLHIGHMRSTIYGDSLKKILLSQGWKVIGSNFLCEAGAQVAKLIVGLRHYKASEIKDERELVKYYTRINKEIENNAELGEETRKVLEKMEAGEKEIASELKKVRNLSVPAMHKIYKELNVKFDEEIYDSNLIESGKKLVQEAIEKKIAFKDENDEIVADLEKYGVPNLIILRSNNTTLYSTRDFGLAESRWEKYKPDLSVIVTGSDQNLHFKQFIKILELMNKPIAQKMKHIGYGLINLPEGKISTRLSRVVLLEDVIQEASEAAEKEITAREPNASDLKQRSRAIGVGALKFAVLKVSAEKNITFDFKTMVSFEGDTSAYLQYSLVRCKSILRKVREAKKTKKEKSENKNKIEKYEFNKEEKELIHKLGEYQFVVEKAARNLAPHIICDYLLKTSATFSKFYSMHSVLEAESEEAKAARIKIVKSTANVLEKGIELLGITSIEKM